MHRVYLVGFKKVLFLFFNGRVLKFMFLIRRVQSVKYSCTAQSPDSSQELDSTPYGYYRFIFEIRCYSPRCKSLAFQTFVKELFTNVKKEDWMQDGGVADPAFKRSRLKPEVYRMTNGRVIVEDEQLNFLAVKTKL